LDRGFAAFGNKLISRKILEGYNQHKSVVNRTSYYDYNYDHNYHDYDHNHDNQYNNNDSSRYSLQFT
jgi:hypothetical protein